MVRISKLTDYAIVILSRMARDPAHIHAATELARESGIALPTVSKVLKQLAARHVVQSLRGAKGGYRLALPPEALTLAQLIDALEGPIAITECSSTSDRCEQTASCSVRGHWNTINRAVRAALESITLADMVQPQAPAPAVHELKFVPRMVGERGG